MQAKLRSILRLPVVWFAYVVDQLRRVPGVRQVERRAPWLIAGLILAAVVVLGVGMAQRSPQRMTIPDLFAGNLAPMQSWIIVTGDLRAQPVSNNGYRYVMTDPAVPDATLIVQSGVELPVGQTTVSGTLIGGTSKGLAGFAWVGQLQADTVLAKEPGVPWTAIGLAAAALFVLVGGRTFYPMFFRQTPRSLEPDTKTLPVSIRRDWPPSASEVEPGSLVLQRGGPAELRVRVEIQQLRLHSAHSSIDVGELRGLRDSEPVLVVRPSTGELTISFASADDRDAAYASLVAEVRSEG